MGLDEHLAQYEHVFDKETPAWSEKPLLPGDQVVRMNPVSAIGKLKDSRAVAEQIQPLSGEQKVEQSVRFLENGHVARAFLQYALGHLEQGHLMEDILTNAPADFGVQGHYIIHKLKKPNPNSTHIFFDWHDTLRVNGGPRLDFESAMVTLRSSRPNHNYAFAVACNTLHGDNNDIGQEVREFGLEDIFDAVYTIPGIGYPVDVVPQKIAGKLYTDICKRIGIDHGNSLIITNSELDRSVERRYPIPTFVVSDKSASAEIWEKIIRHVEDLSTRDKRRTRFSRGLEIMKENPLEIDQNGFRVYQINGTVKLYKPKGQTSLFFVNDIPPRARKLYSQ